MAKRKGEGSLLAVAIIGLCLGGMGVAGACMGIVGTVFQDAFETQQRSILEATNMPEEQMEQQMRLQTEIQDVQRRYRPALIAHQAVNLLASAILVVAGIFLIRRRPNAPGLFSIAAAGNGLVDVGGGIIGAIVQSASTDVMSTMFGDMGTAPGAPPGMERMMEGMMQASVIVGVCFAIGWVVLKLGFYAWGVLVLRKEHVRALLSPPVS